MNILVKEMFFVQEDQRDLQNSGHVKMRALAWRSLSVPGQRMGRGHRNA